MNRRDVVLYKQRPAVVKDFEGDKILIELEGELKKIREKDVHLLVEDVASSINEVLTATCPSISFEDVIDLLEGSYHSFDFLLSLFWQNLPKVSYYKAYELLSTSPFFVVEAPSKDIRVRSKEEILAIEQKEEEKRSVLQKVDEFMNVLKTLSSKKENVSVDITKFEAFFRDLEDVALGKKDEPKLIKYKGLTPMLSHSFLLKSSYWSILKNPYPYRYKKIISQCKTHPKRLIIEDKYTDLTHMQCYAIDNENTKDPDDAISYDGKNLWIHIALVGDSVELDSEYDKMLLERGRSLYLPNGTYYMMGEEDTSMFALGLTTPSYALSFCLSLKDGAIIENVDVMRSRINVTRISYAKATELKDTEDLKVFFDIAKKNIKKREAMGSLSIDIPEVEVVLNDKEVIISSHNEDDSFVMIRELMLLVGEATAFFAFKHNIPFQYISQAPPTNMPKNLETGLAGEFQKRRYVKARSVGTSPSLHAGLGLSMYAQITSPMRRYGDLISQKQLINYIDGTPYISTDELFAKIAMGDISFRESQVVERLSKKHFILVYLLQNPSLTFEATVLGYYDGMAQIYIKSIGLEEKMNLKQQVEPNSIIEVKAIYINLAMLEVTFKEV